MEFTRQDYGHWGVAARLKATQPHHGVARQWFRSPDILALLPFNDPDPLSSYGLVWSVPKARAEHLLALAPEDFERELNDAIYQSDSDLAARVGLVPDILRGGLAAGAGQGQSLGVAGLGAGGRCRASGPSAVGARFEPGAG